MSTMLTYVAGTGFRPGAREHLAALPAGAALTLAREPRNPHDRNAVAVYDGEIHLGYVPAVDARTVAPAMDRGWLVTAEVTREHGVTGLGISW